MKFFINALSNIKYTTFKEGLENKSSPPVLTCNPTGCDEDDMDDPIKFNVSALDSPEVKGGLLMLFLFILGGIGIAFTMWIILAFFGINEGNAVVTSTPSN